MHNRPPKRSAHTGIAWPRRGAKPSRFLVPVCPRRSPAAVLLGLLARPRRPEQPTPLATGPDDGGDDPTGAWSPEPPTR